jgi:hypothetical protein
MGMLVSVLLVFVGCPTNEDISLEPPSVYTPKISNGIVTLEWDDWNKSVDKYGVEFNDESSDYTYAWSSGITTSKQFIFEGFYKLDPGKWYFRVRASSGDIRSGYSNVVSITVR